jgi:hypothetical protein
VEERLARRANKDLKVNKVFKAQLVLMAHVDCRDQRVVKVNKDYRAQMVYRVRQVKMV